MTGISNGITLPNTLANGQTTDAPLAMANYNALLVALNRALLDVGGGSGMNAFGSQLHNLGAGSVATDAATYGQLTGQLASYLPLAGGAMSGRLVAEASATGNAGFNIPVGAVPAAPVAGDFWNTSSGLFAESAGSAFQLGGNGVVGVSATLASSTSLTTAGLGGWGVFTAAGVTTTLPALASTVAGQSWTALGGGYGGTVKGNAAETITGTDGAAANTLVLSPGEAVTFVANATTWSVIGHSYAASALPVGGFTGLKIATQGVNNYTSVVTAGSIVLTSAAGGVYVDKNVNASAAINTSGLNGLDTGSLAASTWYYIHRVYNPTTGTKGLLFSLSATAPTLPSGYTFSARVGAVRTDASGSKYLLQTLQYGRGAQWVPLSSSNLPSPPVLITGTSGSPTVPSWTPLSVAAFVPPTAATIRVGACLGSAGAVMVSPSNAYGANSSSNLTNISPISTNVTNQANPTQFFAEMTLESGNIYYASSATTSSALCYGWEDNL